MSTAGPGSSVIDLVDSDSDSDIRRKRQRTMQQVVVDEDVVMLDAPQTPSELLSHFSNTKNANLKGRKRFNADFADLKAQGIDLGGYSVKKVKAGDDEGMIDLVVLQGDKRVMRCNLTITDTSEYPKSHSIITFVEDDDAPEKAVDALSALQDKKAMPIANLLEDLLSTLSGSNKKTKSLAATSSKVKSFEESDGDEDGSDAEFEFPDYDDFPSHHSQNEAHRMKVLTQMQHDFIEMASDSYRPGLIPFTPSSNSPGGFDISSDFALSISIPTVHLTKTIPAQALVAWDRRLLSTPRRAAHLVLLISGLGSAATSYPPLTPQGEYVRKGMSPRFQVGVCGRYKPSREHAVEAGRTFGLVGRDAEDEVREKREAARAAREAALLEWGEDALPEDMNIDEFDVGYPEMEPEDDTEDDSRFERFSLSSSLEALLETQLVKLVAIRRKFSIGWAGAEVMHSYIESEQRSMDDVWATYRPEIQAADKAEVELIRSGTLPHDPLYGLGPNQNINLPYTAFCYLIRRLTLCTRYCLVCHTKLTSDFEALKPYVCERPLCTYQYYAHNRGVSLEYEIQHNPATVDLLVSLTYAAAAEGVLDQPLPVGMALRVPLPDRSRVIQTPAPIHSYPHQPQQTAVPNLPSDFPVGLDGLVEFDSLPVPYMRAAIVSLIDSLPSIDDMKRHLERKVKPGKSKPRLQEMENGSVLPASWAILRWCVASCTAYLEEMNSEDQCIQGVDPVWRQFRFSVGAPDAEAKFQNALEMAKSTDSNAKKFPSLYAFHGSGLRNWHSIIRHGLWYKTVANGRAFGDGVYLAKEAQTSMGHYATGARACWRKSKLGPTSCVAIAEVVNLPSKFVSSNPHFVIKDTEWIMCRYLLVKGLELPPPDPTTKPRKRTVVPFVKLDPTQPITLQSKALQVPQPGFQISEMVQQRTSELEDEDHDSTDRYIFEEKEAKKPDVIEISDDDEPLPPPTKGKGKGKSFVSNITSVLKPSKSSPPKGPPKDDWKHDSEYVRQAVDLLMLPPLASTPSSTMAVQRELNSMIKEQEAALRSSGGLKELGWFMPQDFIGDNLFQWIVEMHSFDETLPIAKDLKKERINSLIFEIRFPPDFPIAPPFFRIITPRFLPFIQGGGGHVTGGGSICMDLLTSDGWLPSYSIPAVLMQIKLAISNLDPRPARLAPNWNQPYSVAEALQGFKRAAATHGWTVPSGLDKLVR
ncbi:UBIQUITIN-CONJUGAT-2 domain-containing protein [Mycena indigotica]|uniref:UBIQUITIN-CONJUGAT-2 domain-containing protein n=1 Tax=Mycena indigotica TaxID=2126181 RepID=A0A8H6W0J5_9AGAR|nr:UBIQUITIN-CONJUGAT-2 domain-containing protein [Mycena indigotica]KAF7297153.1 UBIQUITIN-CONJUGAT-2 domain-containing protein [Mycena indigotica]